VSLTPGTRIGPYEVTAKIGAGGMGEVYKATDTNLKRAVAIKVLPTTVAGDTERLARFQREAEVLAALNHPNIAQIHGLEKSDGITALVMELVEGPTLADRIVHGAVPLDEALPIAKQIAEALEAAHEQGIVHRDLKPANVKVRPDGTVKLLDFGLAKPTNDDAAAFSEAPTVLLETRTGVVLGTVAYMSPEQARGRAVDGRTDIWAFGCVLYELLTGRRAFNGGTPSDTLAAVLDREPDWSVVPAGTPAGIRRLLRRCLEKDPKRRLHHIADARGEIDDIHAEPEPTGLVKERSRYRALGIAAILLGLILGGYLLMNVVWLRPRDTVRQFVLLPPEGQAFGTSVLDRTPSFAISADGERLAFVATSSSGRRQLWLRRMADLTAEPISGTEGASWPFWSPDGTSIAFFADQKLKRVQLGAGAATTVADAVDGAGGTWNRDGVILFAPSARSGLFRVSELGGTPIPVTQLDRSLDRGHVRPQFLPDGRHFLYLVRATAPRGGIHVGSIDSPETKQLLTTRERALYAPPGHLLFLQDGLLMAQSFDAQTLRLSGDAVTVAQSVAFSSVDGRVAYDVSETGALVYRSSGILATTQPIWVDRSGKTVATVGPPGDYQAASLSPDRSKLAVELHDLRTATGDIWILDLLRGPMTRSTFDGAHNNRAIWSPDGSGLVFAGRADIANLVYKTSESSGSGEPLLPPGTEREPTDWSADGRSILFHEVGEKTGRDLWVLQMPDRKPVPFLQSQFNEQTARFSPNGRWVAYVSNETGRDEVYVRSFPEATGRRQISVNGGQAPRWAGDGKELFFIEKDNSVVAVAVSSSERFEAGVPQRLFTTDMRNGAEGWFSVDGQRFLIIPTPPGPVPAAPPLTVVLDWTSLLKRGGL
jgi:Tol biopolymer transport system component